MSKKNGRKKVRKNVKKFDVRKLNKEIQKENMCELK